MVVKFYNLTILKIFLERGMKKTYLNRHLKTTYMKPAAFTLMLVLFVTITANAQLSFLPQVGLEQSKTSLGINDLPSFSPMGVNNYLKANLRMDYRFKNGHSPYISFGTSPGVVEYSFADPSNAANNFKTAAGSLQFRMEGGYQYSSKPITLKKSSGTKTAQSSTQNVVTKKTCGSYYYYHRSSENTAAKTTTKQNNNLTLRLQPSIGVAYLPSIENDLESNGSLYQYNAGNYKTAMVSGMGFEFGKGKQRLFTLSVFYTKALDKQDEHTIANIENDKMASTTLNSNTSSWGMTVGVPFSFSKNKKTIAPVKTTKAPEQKQYNRSRCGSYSGRCIRKI